MQREILVVMHVITIMTTWDNFCPLHYDATMFGPHNALFGFQYRLLYLETVLVHPVICGRVEQLFTNTETRSIVDFTATWCYVYNM